MTWNYRMIRRQIRTDSMGETKPYYAIHEVFYNDQNTPDSCTLDPIHIGGDTVYEAKQAYERMAEAFFQPTLDWESFGKQEE